MPIKAKGSWFGDHDLDDDGEGPGLAGDGWHAESHLPVQIGGDPRVAAATRWKREKWRRSQMVSKTRFSDNPAYDKPDMVLHKLQVNAGGDGCFGEMIKLDREPGFTNWRQPAKTGAAAR